MQSTGIRHGWLPQTFTRRPSVADLDLWQASITVAAANCEVNFTDSCPLTSAPSSHSVVVAASGLS